MQLTISFKLLNYLLCFQILLIINVCYKLCMCKRVYKFGTTILDINYVDFLQFQRYFTPQAELEESFIYIIHKPIDFSIDFSCRLKT